MDEGWKKDVRGRPGGRGWGGWLEKEEEASVQNTTAVLILSRVRQNHSEGEVLAVVKTDACTPTCAP